MTDQANQEREKNTFGTDKARIVDWTAIKLDYMRGDIGNTDIPPTYQKLSDIHGLARQYIGKRAKAEDWAGERLRARKVIAEKTAEQIQLKEFKDIADSLTLVSSDLDTTEERIRTLLDDGTKERVMQTKDGATTVKENLTPLDLRAITATLRDIAKSKRELLDKASIDSLRYDHRTAMTNFSLLIAEILEEEIPDKDQLQRIFDRIMKATATQNAKPAPEPAPADLDRPQEITA